MLGEKTMEKTLRLYAAKIALFRKQVYVGRQDISEQEIAELKATILSLREQFYDLSAAATTACSPHSLLAGKLCSKLRNPLAGGLSRLSPAPVPATVFGSALCGRPVQPRASHSARYPLKTHQYAVAGLRGRLAVCHYPLTNTGSAALVFLLHGCAGAQCIFTMKHQTTPMTAVAIHRHVKCDRLAHNPTGYRLDAE